MELFDVLLVASVASVLNLIFGQTSFAGPIVFGFPSLMSFIIYWGKEVSLKDFYKIISVFKVFLELFSQDYSLKMNAK